MVVAVMLLLRRLCYGSRILFFSEGEEQNSYTPVFDIFADLFCNK